MGAVTDQKMPDPPAFQTQRTLPLDDINWQGDIVSPGEDNPASMSSGPAAPQGCSLAGCGGAVAYQGTQTWMTDAARTVPGSISGASEEAPKSLQPESPAPPR